MSNLTVFSNSTRSTLFGPLAVASDSQLHCAAPAGPQRIHACASRRRLPGDTERGAAGLVRATQAAEEPACGGHMTQEIEGHSAVQPGRHIL